ncbi:4-hydroxy-3-methylbut-2-enyl diphosphate reductase [Candidatus Fermentibacteria bacterium]|nr:4-hydroxy-3-methylbut-2-enyl diphosphate reductase [Candidatus Fermentibacteria bacterium]
MGGATASTAVKSPLGPNPLIAYLRRHGCVQAGATELVLARETGMCKGVRRALAMVDRAHVSLSSGRGLLLLRPIIHNPTVGRWLKAEGVETVDAESPCWWAALSVSDTVIIPAFGATVTEEAQLRDAGVGIVDTTCPSVRAVWVRVAAYARDGFTTVLHGRPDHPETRATLSRATAGGGHYVVVPDVAGAQALAEAIIRGDSTLPGQFLAPGFHSPGLDPARDLQRLGLVNQTTMLARESLEIADVLRAAARGQFGADAATYFRSFGTICRATQEHQDAVRHLAERSLDLMIVVGGHESSNTRHLAELAAGYVRTVHVEGPEGLLSLRRVRHQPQGSRDAIEADISWLAGRPQRVVGFAGGASTPDAEVGETMVRLLTLLGDPHPLLEENGPWGGEEPAAG